MNNPKQARKCSEDAQAAGYLRFEKVWAGKLRVKKVWAQFFLLFFSFPIGPFSEIVFLFFLSYSFVPSKSSNSATGPKKALECVRTFSHYFFDLYASKDPVDIIVIS